MNEYVRKGSFRLGARVAKGARTGSSRQENVLWLVFAIVGTHGDSIVGMVRIVGVYLSLKSEATDPVRFLCVVNHQSRAGKSR
jgi:hypothetical protein